MRRWRWVIGGILVVLLAAVMIYPLVATANDDVAFCTSCHVMEKEGHTFETSFHKRAKDVTCSDCHTGSLVQKYTDGARHVMHNLTGDYPDPIVIRPATKEVVADQCYTCHQATSLHSRQKHEKGQNCLECHTGHEPRPFSVPNLQ